MHKLHYLLILLLASCTQGVKNHDVATKTKDTVFLMREREKNYYHAVYIDPNPQSKIYKGLTDFTLEKFEAQSYNETYLREKQKHPSPFKKYDLGSLPKEWVPLYSYKGKYYLYSPSDVGERGRCIITDSTLVWWMGDEGPGFKPFQSAKKINDYTYFIKTSNFYNNAKKILLTVHIIDDKNKIAVFDDAAQNGVYRYGLYISKENARKFPVIVNYCAENRVNEFNFDKIDYQKLINTKP